MAFLECTHNINHFYSVELRYSFYSLGESTHLQYSYSEADYLSFRLKPQFACVYNVNKNHTSCHGYLLLRSAQNHLPFF